jgi:Fe-S cluster biogenesis protein NfuA
MNKPHLVVLSEASDVILKGQCSSCEDATFSLPQSTESALALLHGMFSEHIRKVHAREDVSQAASTTSSE